MGEGDKDLFSKEYKRRLKLLLKTKLSGKNKIMAVNTWAVAILRYSAGIVEWRSDDELKELDRKTRKMMKMHGALHPKSDVDRLYPQKQKGGRGLISTLQRFTYRRLNQNPCLNKFSLMLTKIKKLS